MTPRLRELEVVDYTFEILLDYGAYREFRRHRMQTYLPQLLTVAHGVRVPSVIAEARTGDSLRRSRQRIGGPFPQDSRRGIAGGRPVCSHPRPQSKGAVKDKPARVLSPLQAQDVAAGPRVYSGAHAGGPATGKGKTSEAVPPSAVARLGGLEEGGEPGKAQAQISSLGQVVARHSASGSGAVVGARGTHALGPGQPDKDHSTGQHPMDQLAQRGFQARVAAGSRRECRTGSPRQNQLFPEVSLVIQPLLE